MTTSPASRRALVGDLRQIASVRRFILADGPEAGVETLAFSTGGGLDFWITAGRMMDVATLSWRGAQIAWQSPAGYRPRQAATAEDVDRTFNSAFGGFLNTCGFDHIRQPANGSPMHGSAPFTPARLLAFGEDWDSDPPVLYCEGEVVVWSFGSGGYRLRRRVEAPVGGTTIRIRDRIEVTGPDRLPMMALYHFNLGYPLHRNGTRILLGNDLIAGPLDQHETTAAPSNCYAVSGERAACTVIGGCGTVVAFRWRTETLPWLQLWRDLRPACGVLSIEPCSIGRDAKCRNEDAPPAEPGCPAVFEIEVALGDGGS